MKTNVVFINGALKVYGDVENVNAVLADVIFVPD